MARGGKKQQNKKRALDFNREEAAQEVRVLNKLQVAGGTRSAYLREQVHFLEFLYKHYGRAEDSVLVDAFFERESVLTAGVVDWTKVKATLGDYEERAPPVVFGELTAKIVGAYVTYRSNSSKDGSVVRSTAQLWVSAIKDLFRSFNKSTKPEWEDAVARLMNGFARRAAQGKKKVGQGKKPMPFGLLNDLSAKLLEQKQAESVFARCFMLLQWNLMCRASNTKDVSMSTLAWDGDSLAVYYRKQKSDQDGSRSKDPRHVYANPINPAVCVVLALGMYLLVFSHGIEEGDEDEDMPLFPGSDQAQRFNQCLQRLLKGAGRTVLSERGFVPSDFGSHSLRKGSSTFCSSGTTDAPGQVAINLRAGWTMTDVEGRYLRYERAGDQYVGRTVAGLPIHSPDFARLPPTFTSREIANQVVESCLPKLPERMCKVAEMALASVVYHSQWLQDTLPSNHVLFDTSLFTNFEVKELRASVECVLPRPGGPIQASGVPAHVSLRLDVKRNGDELRAVKNAVFEFQENFGDQLREGLNEFTESQGHLTVDKVLTLFESLRTDVMESLRRPTEEVAVDEEDEPEDGEEGPTRGTRTVYWWENGYHLLPEDFELPMVTTEQLWVVWTAGNKTKGWPPLSGVKPYDISTKKMRKRFSDAKTFMQSLEQEAKNSNVWPRSHGGDWKATLTPSEARNCYQTIKETFAMADETPQGRKRRVDQIKWMTHFTEWRKTTKATAAAAPKRKKPSQRKAASRSEGALEAAPPPRKRSRRKSTK